MRSIKIVAVQDPGIDVCELRAELVDPVRALILKGLRDHWGTIDPALNRDLDDLSSAYPDGVTLVACDGNEVVGTGTLRRRDGDTAEIVRMSVAPSHRRTGLGRRLTEALIDTARSGGCNVWCSRRRPTGPRSSSSTHGAASR